MPLTAFDGEVFAEESPVSSVLVAGCPLPFLSFIMDSMPDAETHIAIPQTAADISADLELTQIKEFLTTAQKPADLDDTALKKFVKHATRFFVRNDQLW